LAPVRLAIRATHLRITTFKWLPRALTFGDRAFAPVILFGPVLDRTLLRIWRLLCVAINAGIRLCRLAPVGPGVV